MPIWLYAGNPAPSTDQGPPWPQDRGRPRPGAVLGPEAPPTCLFRLIIWWSGQSAGNLLSKEGRAPQRLHARACGTDSVPPGPLGPRTGPEDQGPPVLGPVGGPRAGCGIVCSRRGWDRTVRVGSISTTFSFEDFFVLWVVEIVRLYLVLLYLLFFHLFALVYSYLEPLRNW